MKLEILKKLSTIKADVPGRGSMIHFIVNIAQKRSPEMLTLSDGWKAIWAVGGEITLRDLERDAKRLVSLVDKARNELNNGVPIVLRDGGENMSKPLKIRLERFISSVEPKLIELQIVKSQAQSEVVNLAQR